MNPISRFSALFAFAAFACGVLCLAPHSASAAEKHHPAAASRPPERDCSGGPMWASFGHPGLGEMINAHRGWDGVPPRKFWLGFIPFFGWPGYLQVVSMIDAAHCRTNDWPND
ncbi:MAG TPA: hypothetical protein VKH41_04495 [Myxococcota bacterium]|nr:hypothetical protein [Myxococcota bacterium]